MAEYERQTAMAQSRNSRNPQSDDQTEEDGRDYGRDRVVQPQAKAKAKAVDSRMGQNVLPKIQESGPNAGLPYGYKRRSNGQVTYKGRLYKGDPNKLANTFTSGPDAGRTYDEAKTHHDKLWDGMTDAQREVWATRARRGATASEVAEADSINGRVGATPAKVTNASLNSGKKPAQVAAVATPSQAASDFADLTKAPVAPGGEAQSVGNEATAANGYQAQVQPPAPKMTAFQAKQASDRAERAKSFTPEQQSAAKEHQVTPTASGGGSTPIGRFFSGIGSDIKDAADWAYNGVTSLGRDDVTAAIIAKREADQKGSRDASIKKEAEETAAKVAAIKSGSTVAPTPAAVSPAQAAVPAVQPVAPAAQVVGPPRSAMPAPEMTGAAVLPTPMGEAKDSAGKVTKVRMDPAIQSDNGAGLTRVNRLTGLPFGHAPGDTLPKSGDQAMQQRAGESIQRQEQAGAYQAKAAPIAARAMDPANKVAPTPIVRGPASQPEQTGSTLQTGAFSNAAYAATAAAQQKGREYQNQLAKKPTMDDVNRNYRVGTPEHVSAAWGTNPTTGAQLTKEDVSGTAPISSRVVATRPPPVRKTLMGAGRKA